ncbi:MAG: aminoacyl-tRNA hydrolase [Acidimicrobiales bacterium]
MLRKAKPAADPGRSGTPADLLVVGLGNPGETYAGSRHNVGLEVVSELARRHRCPLKRSRYDAVVAEATLSSKRLALAFPTTFYNESGRAVRSLSRRFGVDDPESLLVVHDELDLPPGRIRLKRGGGLAGNNGLKSIQAHLHHADFLRVRIGIGKPPGQGVDWVLGRPSKADRLDLDVAVQRAADAVEHILANGLDAAMTVFNRDDL